MCDDHIILWVKQEAFPHYRWQNLGSEKICDLTKFRALINAWMIRIQISLFPSSVFSFTWLWLVEFNNKHWTFLVLIGKNYGLWNSYCIVVDYVYTWYLISSKCRAPWSSSLFPVSEIQLCLLTRCAL